MRLEQEKYILENTGKISVSKIARHLNINERSVKEFLRKNRSKPAPAEDPAKEASSVPPPLGIFFYLLFLLVAGIAIYSNVFGAGFQLDDYNSIINNPEVRNLARVFSKGLYPTLIPHLTFALNYEWGRLDPFLYHLLNILLHVVNGILVFFWVRLTLRTSQVQGFPPMKNLFGGEQARDRAALLAGLIFLCHPLQTQAVSYIVQRITSMTVLFYVGSLFLYAKARLEKKPFYYSFALLAGLAAMFSKQIAYTLPFAILFYEISFLNGGKEGFKKRILPVLPFFGLLLIPYFAVYYQPVMAHGLKTVTRETETLSRSTYFLTELNVLKTYWRLLFFPAWQNIDYDYPVSRSLFGLATAVSALFLSGLIALALVLFRKGYRVYSLGILWFFLVLSIESSIIPIRDVIFEHRLYLVMPGFSMLIAVLLFQILRDQKKFLFAALVLAAVLSGFTFKRNFVWRNEVALWEDAVRKSPEKPRPYHNLGMALSRKGQYDRAVKMFKKAAALNEETKSSDIEQALTYVSWGEALEKTKDEESAVDVYEKAIGLEPACVPAYNNLGNLLHRRNEDDRAVILYQKAITIDPDFVASYVNLGQAYEAQKKYPKAVEAYRKAVELDPGTAEAYANLGTVFLKTERYAEATRCFFQALERNPAYVRSYNNLAVVYNRTGNFAKEIECYKKALEVNPGYANAYRNLGIALSREGSYDLAAQYVKQWIERDPANAEAHYQLGLIYRKAGNHAGTGAQIGALREMGRDDLAGKLENEAGSGSV